MKNNILSVIVITLLLLNFTNHQITAQENNNKDIWVTAYLPSWEVYMGPWPNRANYGQLPVQNIDWNAFTHIIMFAIGPNADGTFPDPYATNLLPERRKPFNDIAHQHGKPVLIALGGAGNTVWSSACSPSNRLRFLNNVLALLDNEQYDGIDLDIEPFYNSGSINDTTNIGPWIRMLYDSLQVRRQFVNPTKKPLLTTAILPGWAGEWWAKHEWMFDQINIMTYDMAQSMGWGVDRTWHNNAVFCPQPPTGTNTYYTSIQTRWNQQIQKSAAANGGVPNRRKYGIGIDFNGTLYRGGVYTTGTGVYAPKQKWSTQPTITWDYDFDLLYTQYLDTATAWSKRYDEEAQAAYLSIHIPDGNSSNEAMVSYTDSTQIARIIKFVRDSTIGGVILWNIGEAYLPATVNGKSVPRRDMMLQIVKNVVNLTPQVPLKKIKGNIFFDQNNNGVFNASEPYLSGWEVSLINESKTLKKNSDANGNYLFDSIPPGIYTISLNIKSGWQITFPSRSNPSYTILTDTVSDTKMFNFGVYSANSIEVSLNAGWNIVSVPVLVSDTRAQIVFPTANSFFFKYSSSGYTQVSLLENGYGYFVKFPYSHKLWISGDLILNDTIDVVDGWNFIGSISKPIATENVITIPPNIIASDFWYQYSGYVVADTIRPGTGYWVKISEPGKIILKSN